MKVKKETFKFLLHSQVLHIVQMFLKLYLLGPTLLLLAVGGNHGGTGILSIPESRFGPKTAELEGVLKLIKVFSHLLRLDGFIKCLHF